MRSNASVDGDRGKKLRVWIYLLLMFAGAALSIGRIWAVKSTKGDTPFLSANDRSRWSAVRSLGDWGQFFIDRAIVRSASAEDCRGRFDSRWNTIDKVRRLAPDGQMRYYSSKPPLLTAVVAAEYRLLKATLGIDFQRNLFLTARLLLIATNVIPLLFLWAMLARVVERRGATTLGRLFVMICAVFGTFLSTFSVTLNNHLPAAVCVMAAVVCALPAWSGRDRRWRWFLGAGFFSALAAANELPALSLAALSGAALALRAPWKTLAGFLPAAGLVAAAFWGLNLAAHQSWRPPYAHRSHGPLVARWTGPQANLPAGRKIPPKALQQALAAEGVELSETARLEPAGTPGDWILYDPQSASEWALTPIDEGYAIRVRDDWYDYQCSYWKAGNPQGVDRGEPSRLAYAAHVLVGHHGLFSLTPIWIFSVFGAALLLWRRAGDDSQEMWAAAVAAAVLTVVCLGFYISRPLLDRNYGGVSMGLRWLFWLIPLWLICLIPAADWLARRKWGIALALLFLGVSIYSAHHELLNPWTHPWLFDLWTEAGGSVGGQPPGGT